MISFRLIYVLAALVVFAMAPLSYAQTNGNKSGILLSDEETFDETFIGCAQKSCNGKTHSKCCPLGVKKTGCSGMAYVVDLAADVQEQDNVFESNGIKVVVDAKSLPYVDGTRIDFTSDGLNETFYYDNPNVKSLCGCGESFGI